MKQGRLPAPVAILRARLIPIYFSPGYAHICIQLHQCTAYTGVIKWPFLFLCLKFNIPSFYTYIMVKLNYTYIVCKKSSDTHA